MGDYDADARWGGEASLGDSGPYSYGMAYVDIPSVERKPDLIYKGTD